MGINIKCSSICYGTCVIWYVQIELSHPILNISTGSMTSKVPDAVSGHIRQALFTFLLHFFLDMYMYSFEIIKDAAFM